MNLPHLIAVAGHSGTGKTTAIEILAELCGGEQIYVGGLVLEEVQRRKLEINPENERIVRRELREQHGQAALIEIAMEKIVAHLSSGRSVLIDAVFHRAELDFIRKKALPFQPILLVIETTFENRCARLRARTDRPLSEEQVKKRDTMELDELGIQDVFQSANFTIQNNQTREAFRLQLEGVMSAIIPL